MKTIWMEYIGSRTPDGIVEDYEHMKFYWGPENNWKCEIPARLAGMIIEEKGVDRFLPCLNPDAQDVSVLLAKIKALETEIDKLKQVSAKIEKVETPKPKSRRKK